MVLSEAPEEVTLVSTYREITSKNRRQRKKVSLLKWIHLFKRGRGYSNSLKMPRLYRWNFLKLNSWEALLSNLERGHRFIGVWSRPVTAKTFPQRCKAGAKLLFCSFKGLWRHGCLAHFVNRELKQRQRRRQRERHNSNRFRLAKQQLCTCITLFCIFLCRHCMTATWKCTISRTLEDVNTKRRLCFSFLELC